LSCLIGTHSYRDLNMQDCGGVLNGNNPG